MAETDSKNSISSNTNNVPILIFKGTMNVKVDAVHSNWDINNSKITIREDVEYTVTPSSNTLFNLLPVVWDGNNKFTFNDGVTPSEYNKNTSNSLNNDVINEIWGRNVKLTQKSVNGNMIFNFDYELDGKLVNRDIQIISDYTRQQNINDKDVNAIGFDGKNINIIFSKEEKNEIVMHLGSYNIKDSNTKWCKVSLGKYKKVVPSPKDSVLISNKYYLVTDDDNIAVIDFEKKKFTNLNKLTDKCKSIIKSTVPNDMGKRSIYFTGSYNDIIFINVPVNTKTISSDLFCAIKDDNILGSVFFKDNAFEVRDSNNKVVSETSLEGYLKYMSLPKYFSSH